MTSLSERPDVRQFDDPPTAPIPVDPATPTASTLPTPSTLSAQATQPMRPARPRHRLEPITEPLPQTLSGRQVATQLWLPALAVAVLALVVRLTGVTTANDLFIDEITYSNLAAMLAHGQQPSQFGVPFFLHPPGSLLPDALAIRLLGLTGPALDQALALRWVHCMLGAVVVGLGYLAMRRATRPELALVGAGVLVFDPFLLRIDTRVMLETSMAVWLLAGTLLLDRALGRPGRSGHVASEVAAGVMLGLAVFAKDVVAVPIVVMLILAVVVRRTLPPRSALRVLSTLPAPYAVYLVVIGLNGLLPAWWNAKAYGLARMGGLAQITGFNAPGAPSLVSRLLVQLSRFGTSYVLIAACAVVGILAARSRHPRRRLLGFLAVGAGGLGLFAAAVGTLEEQFGYVVVLASVLAGAATAADLLERGRWRRTITAVIGVFLALTGVAGIQARLVVDDGYRQVRDWLADSLPAGARVGMTGVTSEFALLPHPDWGVWPSLRSMADHDAGYVVTQSAPLSQGYGYAAPELLIWLQTNAVPVFRFTGPSNGDTVVWRLDKGAVARAVAAGETIAPVRGGYP